MNQESAMKYTLKETSKTTLKSKSKSLVTSSLLYVCLLSLWLDGWMDGWLAGWMVFQTCGFWRNKRIHLCTIFAIKKTHQLIKILPKGKQTLFWGDFWAFSQK